MVSVSHELSTTLKSKKNTHREKYCTRLTAHLFFSLSLCNTLQELDWSSESGSQSLLPSWNTFEGPLDSAPHPHPGQSFFIIQSVDCEMTKKTI